MMSKNALRIRLPRLLVVLLILAAVLGSWLIVAIPRASPAEKQASEDRYTQERAVGYHNPAPKDQITPPEPGPEDQYPTGIFENGDAPFPSIDFNHINSWQDVVNDTFVSVYAGGEGYGGDPMQGILFVDVLSNDPQKANIERFFTPIKAGPVKITGVHNLVLELESTSGASFVFDLQSRSFVDNSN